MTSETITIRDPELARMFAEDCGPNWGDIPGAVQLGRTNDGRTRDDFKDEEEFEDMHLRKAIKYATIADVDAHLAYEGAKARQGYLRILSLAMIRDKMLERANGDSSANFLELLNAHLADHQEAAEGGAGSGP